MTTYSHVPIDICLIIITSRNTRTLKEQVHTCRRSLGQQCLRTITCSAQQSLTTFIPCSIGEDVMYDTLRLEFNKSGKVSLET